ncbi:unnamed protein product, partial [Protopolystoma xenopodis]
ASRRSSVLSLIEHRCGAVPLQYRSDLANASGGSSFSGTYMNISEMRASIHELQRLRDRLLAGFDRLGRRYELARGVIIVKRYRMLKAMIRALVDDPSVEELLQ